MKEKELRELIGSRAKQRRLELDLKQPYVAGLTVFQRHFMYLWNGSKEKPTSL